jgi:hypothetical protein
MFWRNKKCSKDPAVVARTKSIFAVNISEIVNIAKNKTKTAEIFWTVTKIIALY